MGNICGSTVSFPLGEGHSRRPFLFLFWKGRGIRNCWNCWDMESNKFFFFCKRGDGNMGI